MSTISKLYSYYWTNLWRKNWIKITLLTLWSALWAFFILSFGSYQFLGKSRAVSEIEEADSNITAREIKEIFKDYSSLCRWGLKDERAKELRQVVIEWERKVWEDLKQANESGDESKIKAAERDVRHFHRLDLAFRLIFGAPSFHWEVNDFFLQVEPRNKGVELWRLMNDLGWWLLATGVVFSWLTLSIVDFLFVEPKKNGEEALLLNFTPGVEREDLLISRILVFLTYFSLFALLSAGLPLLLYYIGIGGLVSAGKFFLLLGYLLVVAPLLIFGLLLFPYILISEWSPTLASLLPWLLVSISFGYTIFKFLSVSPLPHKIENWIFHPVIFTALSVTLGMLCFTIYYFKTQSQDVKG
ncbi:MAG: hypothetical protein MRERC_4c045 [Mycoplasmataceae bacterium RC_NB112A]|nr:MAG: hypothetical protein MRERC_4c045 [Mycoplasmataceae bacterium RC_NB112A]